LDITNPDGTTVCPEIGVTRYLNQPQEGISMKMIYIGNGTTSVPLEYRGRTYLQANVLLNDGSMASSGNYSIRVDNSDNTWHRMKIKVSNNGYVSFYLDNGLLWESNRPVDASLMSNKNLLLGLTSPGSAGKAYHNWVQISYGENPDYSYNNSNHNLEE
jgi:hypothetical protein